MGIITGIEYKRLDYKTGENLKRNWNGSAEAEFLTLRDGYYLILKKKKMETQQITQQALAEKLIFPLFRSISEDYKVRYVRNIWEQFENGIRAAAYTSKLNVFLENITSQLPIEIQAKYIQEISEVVSSGQDEIILDWLRDETTYLVMIARIMNQNRKELFK